MHKRHAILCTLVLLGAGVSGTFSWAGVAGKVTDLDGLVEVVRGADADIPGSGEKIKAVLSMDILEKDILVTGRNGKIEVTLRDKTFLRLAPESRLTVTRNTQIKQSKTTILNLLNGKVKAKVGKLGQADTFEVRTPTAVAGVRGTIFACAYNAVTGKTEVIVLDGMVDVTPVDVSTGKPKVKAKTTGRKGKKISTSFDGETSETDASQDELDEAGEGMDKTTDGDGSDTSQDDASGDDEDTAGDDEGEEGDDGGGRPEDHRRPPPGAQGAGVVDDLTGDILDGVTQGIVQNDTFVDQVVEDAGLIDLPLPPPPPPNP